MNVLEGLELGHRNVSDVMTLVRRSQDKKAFTCMEVDTFKAGTTFIGLPCNNCGFKDKYNSTGVCCRCSKVAAEFKRLKSKPSIERSTSHDIKYCGTCKRNKSLSCFDAACKKCRLCTKKLRRKSWLLLEDGYIRSLLSDNSDLKYDEIPQDLIEAKRIQIKISRATK